MTAIYTGYLSNSTAGNTWSYFDMKTTTGSYYDQLIAPITYKTWDRDYNIGYWDNGKKKNSTASCGYDIQYTKAVIKCFKENLYTGYTGRYWDDADTTTYGNTWKTFTPSTPMPKTPRERLMEMLQQRSAPRIVVARQPIVAPRDVREERARETLRLCLGEDVFRLFLKNGFVSVRAKSGLVYQIFPGHGITCVYKNGQMIERLCVVFRGDFPPADSLVMRFLLILNDEEEFRSHAVKHGVIEPKRTQLLGVDSRSLTEAFREFKAKVAA